MPPHDTVPPRLDQLFTNVIKDCNEEEKRQIVADLKERYPDSGAHQPEDLKGSYHKLYLSGLITHEDLGILYHTAEKSLNKGKIVSHLDEFKRSQPLKSESSLVGRSKEKQELLELLSDKTTHSVNIHGVQGVGKTTMAKEVVKEMEKASWETIKFDLREAKDIDTAYLFILFILGHTAISRSYKEMDTKTTREKERTLILSYLQDKCENSKLLLLFDNIESELVEKYKEELVCFLNSMTESEACKTGKLMIILTSILVSPVDAIKNYNLEPLTRSTSKDLISRRSKLDLQSDLTFDYDDENSLNKVAEYCQQIPYLLESAEHLLRSDFITSQELLQKIETQIHKGLPKKYVTTGTLFESIPTENLKKLAVKLCVFPKSFSSSEVKDIADLKSEYDALLDLEYLARNRVVSKVITEIKTDGKTETKTEYEVHSLFKEFSASYLRAELKDYQEAYSEAEVTFGHHFTDKMLQLADRLDKDFAGTFLDIQKDKVSFDVVFQLSFRNERILEKLIAFQKKETICCVAMILEALKSIGERKVLFRTWADTLKEKGDYLTSAYMRCWESMQLADMEGTLPSERMLDDAEVCFNKAAPSTEIKQFNAIKCLILYCKGKLSCMKSAYITSKKDKKEKNDLIKRALQYCEGALEINRSLYNDGAHIIAVRTLNCMGNCYMEIDDPKAAETYYREALYLKLELTNGNEIHSEIPTFYNQLSQVYQKLGDLAEKHKPIIDRSRLLGRISKKAKEYYERAVSYIFQAIKLNKMLNLDDTLSTATFHRNLANMLIALKRYDEALEYAEQSYSVRIKCLGNHPETVRVLYLMGVINEWRKNRRAALLNYEEAFHMEESLPKENHSMVKDLVCKQLEKMCNKYKEKEKLHVYKPRMELLKKIDITQRGSKIQEQNLETPQDEYYEAVQDLEQHQRTVQQRHHKQHDETEDEQHDETAQKVYKLTLDEGVVIQVPAGVFKKQTNLTVKKVSKDDFPSPCGELEDVVSYVIQFEPSNLVLGRPIDVTLLHCGPLHTPHYENVAMGYDNVTSTWEQIQELQEPPTSESSPIGSIQVQLTKLTAVTVVTRLISDTFEVPVNGCQVKSFVCPDVTLQFPPRAVEKITKGSIKVLPMPEVLPIGVPQGVHFCPIVVVDGFADTVFSEDVTLTVPYPATCQPAGHERAAGEIHVMRYEDKEWKEITDATGCFAGESKLEIRVKQFSMLWVYIFFGAAAITTGFSPLSSNLYNRLNSTPKQVHFLAYKFIKGNPIEHLKILVVLVSDIFRFDRLRQFPDSKIYEELSRITGNEDIYASHIVYPNVKGGFELRYTDVNLRLVENGLDFKELEILEKKDDDDERLIIEFCLNLDNPCKPIGRIAVSKESLGLKPRISPLIQGPLDDGFYIQKGLLIVIEIETFTDETVKNRKGSLSDCKHLIDTFEKFRFNFKRIQNRTEEFILQVLEKISKDEHYEHDCCVVCIMSHGELDGFFDINWNKIEENKIISILKEYFYGKPKLLFLQTCRTLPDQTTENRTTSQDQATMLENPLNDADMLIGYSCCEGRKAYRDEVSGSFFLQTLCEVFQEKFKEMDVESMLIEVNNRLLRKEPKQVCDRKSTLSKKVYFTGIQ